ncbi:MAG TPA: hypothetical protein VLG50_00215 [Candidatus Saccharimonadales bacterium]|nr:hypothetical protein [Candidatus Saccharimonadales bacterium]
MKEKYFLFGALVLCFVPEIKAFAVSCGAATNIVDNANVGIRKDEMIGGKIVAGVIGLLLATKIGYDISWHSTYENRAAYYYQSLKQYILDNDITSVTDPLLLDFSNQEKSQDIVYLENSISNSYNSWVCFWNWTESEKIAYSNMQAVSILTLYADLMRLGNKLTDKDIVQYCRNMYVSITIYPYVTCCTKMQAHIDFINSLVGLGVQKNIKLYALLQQMTVYLQKFKSILMAQKEYVDELQTMKTHTLLQQSINAQQLSRIRG